MLIFQSGGQAMKYRILKKKNTLSRAKFIADKIGVIERGVWVEYFKKHPTDLSKVMKRISSQNFKRTLKRDIHSNYHNSSFNQDYCNWVIYQLENGCFHEYSKLSLIGRLNYSLLDIPINNLNPYGINKICKNGRVKSTGVYHNL